VHQDTLTDLVIDGERIRTTEDHPFWSVTDQMFEDAQDLAPGEKVLAADGRIIEVVGLDAGSAGRGTAYNLTVEGLHTYYVGHADVLVHNCGSAGKSGAELPEGYSSFSAAKRAMGSPGEGNVFDHVVEQSQIKRSGFAPEEIHNPFNMNPVSARTNQIKANYYSSKQPFTGGGTVRDWLTGQSFADQYSFGMDVLTQIRRGIIQ
jgi:hypothetical protein